MKHTKYIFCLLLSILMSVTLQGQLSSVDFQLEYEESTSLYIAKLIINSGSATTPAHRTQFNAQYTLIVPTGSTFNIVESMNPLQGNFTSGTGTISTPWSISSSILSPNAKPESDFYSLVPSISPTARYNDLMPGDVVDLFKIEVLECAVPRLFINGTDPAAPDLNMNDFSNGFTTGSPSQIYSGNQPTINEQVGGVYIAGSNELCLGETTTVFPNNLGFWISSDPTIATVSNDGIVTAVSAGTTDIIWDYENGDCLNEISVTVHPEILTILDGPSEICIGETTQIIATTSFGNSTPGEWTSANPAVASIDADGVITGISEGTAVFSFYSTEFDCYSSTSEEIIVNKLPDVTVDGLDQICVGDITFLSSGQENGTWFSSALSIATVDDNIVTGIGQGICTFTFISSFTGCSSEGLSITVLAEDNELCTVYTTDIGDKSITVFPNPVTEILHITGSQKIEHVSIFDINGKVVMDLYESSNRLDQIIISHLPSNMYFIKVKTANHTLFQKIVKQ